MSMHEVIFFEMNLVPSQRILNKKNSEKFSYESVNKESSVPSDALDKNIFTKRILCLPFHFQVPSSVFSIQNPAFLISVQQ